LTALPAGDDARRPQLLGLDALDSIGNFDPVDLERWVLAGETPPGPSAHKPKDLLF
jgi:hypothetical protein